MQTAIKVTELSGEDFGDICDAAGYSIGYWALRATLGEDVYTIIEQDNPEPVVITRQQMLDTINNIIDGKYDIGSSQRYGICHAFTLSDIGDLDGYDVDVLIQIAAFGEVVYG